MIPEIENYENINSRIMRFTMLLKISEDNREKRLERLTDAMLENDHGNDRKIVEALYEAQEFSSPEAKIAFNTNFKRWAGVINEARELLVTIKAKGLNGSLETVDTILLGSDETFAAQQPQEVKEDPANVFGKFVGWLALFVIGFAIFAVVMDDTKPTSAVKAPAPVVKTLIVEAPAPIVEESPIEIRTRNLEEKAAKAKADKEKKETEARKLEAKITAAKALPYSDKKANWMAYRELCNLTKDKAFCDKAHKYSVEYGQQQQQLLYGSTFTCGMKEAEYVFTVKDRRITKMIIKESGRNDVYINNPERNWKYLGGNKFKHNLKDNPMTCKAGLSGRKFKPDTTTYAMSEQQALLACREEFRRQGIFGTFSWDFTTSKVSSTKVIIVRQVIKTNSGKQTHQCAVKPNGQVNYQGRIG